MVPRPAPAQIQGLAELPPADADAEDGVRVRLTEHAAQADLTALLRVCDSGKLRCSETTRRPSAATVKAVTAVLDEGDFYAETPIAAFAWPLLVQAGGLAEIAGGRLQLTARGRRALQAPAPETLKHLWNRWLDHGLIDEFSRVEAIKGQQASGGRNLTAVPPRRRAVAAALAGAPPQRWIAVDGFFAFMQAAGHDFAVVRDTWHLYIGDPQYGNFGYAGYGDWSVIQGRFVLCLLLEFAATLGLIDVAYVDPTWARDDYRDQWGTDDLDALSRYDGLRFFRVNALGAYCVGRAEHYQPSPQIAASGRPILRLLPNLDLVFTGRRLPAADALLLERYTEVRSAGVWTLRREKLLAAVARGEGPQELEQFLRERTEPPLPDTAADLLAEVRERAGRLSDLGAVRLVECADANLALLLAHDRRLRGHCRLFGERHLAVPAEHEERFRQALWEVGYALPPAGAGGSAGAARP